MNLSDVVSHFFDLIVFYIDKVVSYLGDSQLTDLISYLFNCIPVELQYVLFLGLFLFVLALLIRIFKG